MDASIVTIWRHIQWEVTLSWEGKKRNPDVSAMWSNLEDTMAGETAVGRSAVTMIHIGQGVANGKTIETV